MDNKDIKIIHQWTVSVKTKVDETTTEVRNGQQVKMTATVEKDVPHKMGLKQLTRREARQAELFYSKRYNFYQAEGFLTNSMVADKYFGQTGNAVSTHTGQRIELLRSREAQLNNDLVRIITSKDAENEKKRIQEELVATKVQLTDLYSMNSDTFRQTAEKWAERDLNDWLMYFLIYLEIGGKWEPFFSGSTFEEREVAMWKLEESADPIYEAATASGKISLYIGMFNMGINTSEGFVEMEKKLEEQRLVREKVEKEEADKLAAEKVAKEASATPTEQISPDVPDVLPTSTSIKTSDAIT